jgi:hypothetical protein
MAEIRVKRTSSANTTNRTLLPGELALAHDTLWYGPYESSNTTDQPVVALALAKKEEVNALKTDLEAQIQNLITSAVDYLGVVNSASALSTTAERGDFYRAGSQFVVGSTTIHANDIIIAAIKNPTQTIGANGWDVIHSGDMGVTQVSALNTSISIGGTAAAPTIAHGDTSNVANLVASSRSYVTSLTFDGYGHVTGYSVGTETVTDTKQTWDQVSQPSTTTYYLVSTQYSTGTSPDPMATHSSFKILNNILYAPQFEGKVDGGEWS